MSAFTVTVDPVFAVGMVAGSSDFSDSAAPGSGSSTMMTAASGSAVKRAAGLGGGRAGQLERSRRGRGPLSGP